MTRRLSLFLLSVRAWAQPRRISPRGYVEGPFGSGVLQITYGRPYRPGRKLFGNLVPYKQLWRTGADESTALGTTVELAIGSLTVPPGHYSLLTIPEKDRWTLIVNKEPDLQGIVQYNRKKDLGRVEMEVAQLRNWWSNSPLRFRRAKRTEAS